MIGCLREFLLKIMVSLLSFKTVSRLIQFMSFTDKVLLSLYML